jgi:phosphohistidine phosphatase
VLLLRHAKSAWGDPRIADYQRALAPRGRRAAAVVGCYLADERLAPDLVLCSGAKRARQTWRQIARLLVSRPASRFERELYMATPGSLLTRLQRLPDRVRSVLLIGHEGSVDRFAVLLAGSGDPQLISRMAARFPTAALAVISLGLATWRDLGEGQGRLERFVSPKDLV